MGWFDSNWNSGQWFESYWFGDSLGGGVFPTQYAGLRIFYGGVVNELCLVAVTDAPSGMGGMPVIRKNGVNYAVYLVETSDADASSVRLKTTTGIKSIRLKT